MAQLHGHRQAQAAHHLYSLQSHLRAVAEARDTLLVMVLLADQAAVVALAHLLHPQQEVLETHHLHPLHKEITEGTEQIRMRLGRVVVLMRQRQQQPQEQEQRQQYRVRL